MVNYKLSLASLKCIQVYYSELKIKTYRCYDVNTFN